MKVLVFFSIIIFICGCSPKKAQLEILPDFFDLGKIKKDTVYKGYAIIKNSGKSVLEIQKISADCGCTSVSLSKDKIEPSDTCLLNFKYNTYNKIGNQENYIFLTANTDLLVHALEINAYIE